jgi:hypothetical protein
MMHREGTPGAARPGRRLLQVLAVVSCVVGGLAAGCSEDDFGNATSIEGHVLDDADDTPIFGVNIGVVYEPVLPAPGPPRPEPGLGRPAGGRRLDAAAAALQNPYPNPGVGLVSIPLAVDGPTALRVEIRATFAGVTGDVALVFDGIVTQDTTLSWEGTDNFNEDVPNGLYTVRLTSPPGSTAGAVDKAVVVNRSSAQMQAQGIFNAVSGAEGEYFLDDLAVGREFTATNSSGQTLGQAHLADRVTLAFRDPDFVPQDESVLIGQGDVVTQTTRLHRLIPAAAAVE